MLKFLIGLIMGNMMYWSICHYGYMDKLGKYLPKCKCNKKKGA